MIEDTTLNKELGMDGNGTLKIFVFRKGQAIQINGEAFNHILDKKTTPQLQEAIKTIGKHMRACFGAGAGKHFEMIFNGGTTTAFVNGIKHDVHSAEQDVNRAITMLTKFMKAY